MPWIHRAAGNAFISRKCLSVNVAADIAEMRKVEGAIICPAMALALPVLTTLAGFHCDNLFCAQPRAHPLHNTASLPAEFFRSLCKLSLWYPNGIQPPGNLRRSQAMLI
jgi:hypothetical protein